MSLETYKSVVDALIFASDEPLSVQKIKQILDEGAHEEITTKLVKDIIDEINRDNRDQQRGFFLQEVAGGFQYRTRPNYANWVKKLRKSKPFRLTQSTLETLAIIAYRQPIIRAEIDKIRGVDSGGIIKNLLERNLIKIMGRKNIAGRPYLLGTTKRFLEVFGLEKLADMPSLKDLEELDGAQLPSILQETAPENIIEIDDSEEGAAAEDRHVTEDDIGAHMESLENGGDDTPAEATEEQLPAEAAPTPDASEVSETTAYDEPESIATEAQPETGPVEAEPSVEAALYDDAAETGSVDVEPLMSDDPSPETMPDQVPEQPEPDEPRE